MSQPPLTTREVNRPRPHDSGTQHVAGSALYVDDLQAPAGTLHACFGLAPVGRAKITALDLDAVHAAPGVVDVVTAGDIPGENNAGPVIHDEPLLAENEILFPGQALFCVLAENRIEARKAARLFKLESEELSALTTVDDAVDADSFLHDPMVFKRGDCLLYTSPSPRDGLLSRMPSSA